MKILILIEQSIMNNFWALITINSYHRILLNNITQDVVIDNYDNIYNYLHKNYIIITFSINLIDFNRFLLLKNEKVILINVDYYSHFHFKRILDIINSENLDFTIFDYNPINLIEISTIYKNIKIEYIPLLYNSYLEEHFNSQISNHDNKDIDILFYGKLNQRREQILEKLKTKYKVHTIYNNINGISDNELSNLINRSKIVLNIYFYDYNKVFDYYRNSYLIANKVFLISEYPDNINFNIERNLIDIDRYLKMGKYENLVDLVSYYIDNYSNIDINNILQEQYNWFSNNKLENLFRLYFTRVSLI